MDNVRGFWWEAFDLLSKTKIQNHPTNIEQIRAVNDNEIMMVCHNLSQTQGMLNT